MSISDDEMSVDSFDREDMLDWLQAFTHESERCPRERLSRCLRGSRGYKSDCTVRQPSAQCFLWDGQLRLSRPQQMGCTCF